MKGMYLCLPAVLLLLAGACQPAETPLTDAEKGEITAAVRAVFDTMVQGMNEHDVDMILGCYWKSDQLRFAGDGELISGWDNLYEMASAWHADPAVQNNSHSIDDVVIDVLTRDIALVTARGVVNLVDEEGNKSQLGYTVTDVFQRQESGWIVINEHESVAEPANQGFPQGAYTTEFQAADLLKDDPPILAGKWTLTFGADGKFTGDHDGQRTVEGVYTVSGDRVTIDKETGPEACTPEGHKAGEYSWKTEESLLRFVKIADTCDGRASVFTRHPLTPVKR